MANTMKVQVILTVEVDLDAMKAEYGIEGPADVREDVRYSFLNAAGAVYPESSNVVKYA